MYIYMYIYYILHSCNIGTSDLPDSYIFPKLKVYNTEG